MVKRNEYLKNLAKQIVETTAYDPDSNTLFVSNPGISAEVLKSLAKKHNFTIGQIGSGEYVSIPGSFKYTKDEALRLYDDFLDTYTIFSKNYETLQSIYSTLDTMDENVSEISLILNTYVAEVLSQGFIDDPLKIAISDPKAQCLIDKVFYRNKIYNRLPEIVRNIAKYGNYGMILQYPYLEQWQTDDDSEGFDKLDIVEDLYLTSVNPKYFKVNTDEFLNPINYETTQENRYVNIVAKSSVTAKTWQPWQFCFTGDTKISLLDGRELSLLEIQKEFGQGTFWVYSCTPEGRIVPGRAHSLRKTKENASLIEIELDNGEKIHCTPNHKFMLRDGTYCEAQNLKPNISLMPLYRKRINSNRNRRGYEQHFDNAAKKWLYTHYKVAQTIYGAKRDKNGKFTKSWHIHHKDFNSLNNSPDNLQWLTCAEHNALHNAIISDPILDAPRRKASSEALRHTWKNNYSKMCENAKNNAIKTVEKRLKETGQKVTEVQRNASKKNILICLEKSKNKKKIISEETKEKLAKIRSEIGKRNKGRKQNLSEEQRLARKLQLAKAYNNIFIGMNDEQKKQYLSDKAKKGWETRKQKEAAKLYNHKVVAIREYTAEDVYDFTVDEYHNFALSAGVFVHNCHFLLPDETTAPYGKSMLWSMRSAFDQLTTLEALLGISRASNIQRLVFTVPMPNGISMVDAYGFMNEFRSQYLNSIFTDYGTSKAGRKIPGALSILTLPETYDGKKVGIDKVEANIDLSSIEDVQYFLDKILRNSALPKGYLVGEDVITTSQALDAQDLKLKRTLIPLKQALITGIMTLVENILAHAGYDVTKLNVDVSLNEPVQVPADVIEKYGKIMEFVGGLLEFNPQMPNINKFQLLVKLGMPTDLSTLICAQSSVSALDVPEDLAKFLLGQKVKDTKALPTDVPELEETVSIKLSSKQYLNENTQTLRQLKSLCDVKREKGFRYLAENALKSEKMINE